MSKLTLTIDTLLTIDDSGMPVAPSITQLLDKDVKKLYLRDTSRTKDMYIKEVGVIYYLADPKGPCKQAGLSDKEAIIKAIENFDLPSTYSPDLLVWKLIKRYYDERITIKGAAVESLKRSIHNVALASNKINEILTDKMNSASVEDIQSVVNLMDALNKKVKELPELMKALNDAEEALMNEEEQVLARGGVSITSSMIEE